MKFQAMSSTDSQSPSSNSSILRDRLAMATILGGLVVRAVAGAIVPPGFDEAYYGVYSLHPAWGFFDHPPTVAVTAGIGRWLTGSFSPLSLRFGALLIFLFSAVVLYRLTLMLSGRRAARIALFLLHATPFFFIGMGAFVLPDNALGLWWLLFLLSLAKVRETKEEKWLLLAGLSLGLALLAKYHAVLLLPALLYCLVFHEEWRHLLRSPYLYVGMVIALLCFMPNIYWNYEHHWVSYLYQFGKGDTGLHVKLSLFLQGILVQAAYLLPWNLWLFVAAAVWTWRRGAQETRWLLPFVVIPAGAFTLIGATTRIMPHWPMPGYIAALVLAGDWMARWEPLNMRRFLRTSGITTLVVVVVVSVQALTGIIPLKRKADLTLDGQGWRDVARQLESDGLLKDKNCFCFSNKWFTAGELAYALGGHCVTTVLDPGGPHAFAFWTKMSDLVGKDGIFVTTERFPDDPKEAYGNYFKEYVRLDDITTYRGGKPAQVFHLWLCRDLGNPRPWAYGNN